MKVAFMKRGITIDWCFAPFQIALVALLASSVVAAETAPTGKPKYAASPPTLSPTAGKFAGETVVFTGPFYLRACGRLRRGRLTNCKALQGKCLSIGFDHGIALAQSG
ncbi:MAG TPA: hypothetical protein VHC22_10340 [Pirellulales bacterium]|nr:hypothetical protein [Pirellulales bacterium]